MVPSKRSDDKQFTEEQRQTLLKMIEQDERVKWWWASTRVWTTWVSAGVVAAYALYEAISKFIRGTP